MNSHGHEKIEAKIFLRWISNTLIIETHPDDKLQNYCEIICDLVQDGALFYSLIKVFLFRFENFRIKLSIKSIWSMY